MSKVQVTSSLYFSHFHFAVLGLKMLNRRLQKKAPLSWTFSVFGWWKVKFYFYVNRSHSVMSKHRFVFCGTYVDSIRWDPRLIFIFIRSQIPSHPVDDRSEIESKGRSHNLTMYVIAKCDLECSLVYCQKNYTC